MHHTSTCAAHTSSPFLSLCTRSSVVSVHIPAPHSDVYVWLKALKTCVRSHNHPSRHPMYSSTFKKNVLRCSSALHLQEFIRRRLTQKTGLNDVPRAEPRSSYDHKLSFAACAFRYEMCGSMRRSAAERPQSVDGCRLQDLDCADTVHLDCLRHVRRAYHRMIYCCRGGCCYGASSSA